MVDGNYLGRLTESTAARWQAVKRQVFRLGGESRLKGGNGRHCREAQGGSLVARPSGLSRSKERDAKYWNRWAALGMTQEFCDSMSAGQGG